KIMGTPVQAQSATNPEPSKPVTPVVINTATVFTDTQDGVLRISAPAAFQGTSMITVTASDSDGPVSRSFTEQVVPDTQNDRPFLGTLTNPTTTMGTAVTFSLPATDLENDQLTFAVRNPNNFALPPANVTVSIDQANHRATVTPNPGFSGTV